MKFGAKTRNEMNLELGYYVLYLAFKSFTALFVLHSFLILHWQWVWEFNLFTQKVMLISLFFVYICSQGPNLAYCKKINWFLKLKFLEKFFSCIMSNFNPNRKYRQKKQFKTKVLYRSLMDLFSFFY